MDWKEFTEIMLIPQEGRALAIKARVKDLIKAGGLPSFAKTWEPTEYAEDSGCLS